MEDLQEKKVALLEKRRVDKEKRDTKKMNKKLMTSIMQQVKHR